MSITPFAHDPFRRPTGAEALAFLPKKLQALWRWRNYAREDADFIKRLATTGVTLDTLWDVGGSNGAWSWIVGRSIPRMQHHLFEPLAGHVESYASTLRHHLAAHPNWTLHPVALGELDAEATIYADQNSYGSSLIESDYARQNWRSVAIKVRSGDSLIAAGEAPSPDIVKADTQGFELAMLKGLEVNLGSVKALLLETWLSRGYGAATPLLTELITWLAERDFVPVDFGDGYRDPAGHLRSVDAFFLRRVVAEKAGFAL
jgi:FkbM family methyltransferase